MNHHAACRMPPWPWAAVRWRILRQLLPQLIPSALVVVQQDGRARSRPLLLVVTTAWTARKKAVESARLRARRGPVALLTTAAAHSYRFVEPSSSLQFEVWVGSAGATALADHSLDQSDRILREVAAAAACVEQSQSSCTARGARGTRPPGRSESLARLELTASPGHLALPRRCG